MNREQAIELARLHAKAKPESYYAEPFQPHDWVIDAIMAAEEAGRESLRPALIGLVGASTPSELRGMEAITQSLPDGEDKSAIINAIHALLETFPEDQA